MVRIPIDEGMIDGNLLFDAVSKDLHWVAGSITAFSRNYGLRDHTSTQIPVSAVENLSSQFPGAFRFEGDSKNPDAIQIDVERLAEMLADRKSRLRKFLALANGSRMSQLQRVESTWPPDGNIATHRVIVVLAGLHGTESSAEDVAKELHLRTNLPTCVFRYPNDGPIRESSGMLVLRLRDFLQEHPQAKITLVTHSMGGLVARSALEFNSPAVLKQGAVGRQRIEHQTGVDQLIQICPPNHGSALAEYGPVLEGAEQAYRLVARRSTKKSRRIFQAIVDGFNEASADLEPDSKFLQELNQQSRNPNVRYTILLGDDGPLRNGMSTLLTTVWNEISANVNEPEQLNQRISAVLGCSELRKGQGDGVVSIRSARLEGVEDQQVLPMHHLVWNDLASPEGKQMLREVAKRIGIPL